MDGRARENYAGAREGDKAGEGVACVALAAAVCEAVAVRPAVLVRVCAADVEGARLALSCGEREGVPEGAGEREGESEGAGVREREPDGTGVREREPEDAGEREGEPEAAGEREGVPEDAGEREGDRVAAGDFDGEDAGEGLAASESEATTDGVTDGLLVVAALALAGGEVEAFSESLGVAKRAGVREGETATEAVCGGDCDGEAVPKGDAAVREDDMAGVTVRVSVGEGAADGAVGERDVVARGDAVTAVGHGHGVAPEARLGMTGSVSMAHWPKEHEPAPL